MIQIGFHNLDIDVWVTVIIFFLSKLDTVVKLEDLLAFKYYIYIMISIFSNVV